MVMVLHTVDQRLNGWMIEVLYGIVLVLDRNSTGDLKQASGVRKPPGSQAIGTIARRERPAREGGACGSWAAVLKPKA